jgi:transposase
MQPKIYTDKFKIHPSDNQVSLFNSFISNKRFIYNYQVAAYINSLKNKEDINIRNLRGIYRKDLKNGNIKLKDGRLINDEFKQSLVNTPSQISDMTNEDIIRAIKDIKKNKYKKTKKPSTLKFRKKSNDKRSFTIHMKNDKNFKYDHATNTLKIVKIDEPLKLNTRLFHYYTGNEKIKRITISNTNYGWYISITYEIKKMIKQYSHNNTTIGIDWGLSIFLLTVMVKLLPLINVRN